MSEMNEAPLLHDGDDDGDVVVFELEESHKHEAPESYVAAGGWDAEKRASAFRSAAQPTVLYAFMVYQYILFVSTRIFSSDDPELKGNLFRMETFIVYSLALMYTLVGFENFIAKCIVRDDDYHIHVTGRVLYQLICFFFVSSLILAFIPIKFSDARWIEFSDLTGASLSAFIIIAKTTFSPMIAHYDNPHYFHLFNKMHWMLKFCVQIFFVGLFIGIVFMGVLVANAPPYTYALMQSPSQIVAFTSLLLFAQAISWVCVLLTTMWLR